MRRPEPTALGALRAGAIVATLSSISLLASGCYTHNCDPSCVSNGPLTQCPGGGQPQSTMTLDSVTTALPDGEIEWSSSPVAGPWLDFPGMRTYVLYFSQPFATAPNTLDCQIATDAKDPQGTQSDADTFVPCGSIAQFSQLTATSVVVKNPTCAGYGLRVFARDLPASFDGGSPALTGDSSTD